MKIIEISPQELTFTWDRSDGSTRGSDVDGKGNEEGFIRSATNVRNLNPCKTEHFG
jgi:hypothetical protein